jgi:predicted permease
MVFARRKPGVSVRQAQANLAVIARQLYESYPQNWRNRRGEPRVLTVLSESDSRVIPQAAESVKLFLALLLTVVGLVLLVACANVANLLLARGMARRKEIGIRLSQGASRGRLVRQLLTENLLLALIAGVLGLVLASWTTRLLASFQPPLSVSLAFDLSVDGRVLAFAVLLALATGILFGLVPALRATRPDLVQVLKEEGGGAGGGYHRSILRNGLVILQTAMSLMLLVGAGLSLRSMGNAYAIDPGFHPDNVLLLSMDLKSQGYTPERGKVFYRELQERVEQLPGVEAVSVTDRLPLGLDWQRRSMTAEGQQPAPGEDLEHHYAVVGPDFFRAIKTPIVRGRGFTAADTEGAPEGVVVSEAFAQRFWPGQEPLGKWIVLGGYRGGVPAEARRWNVVGIAGDAKYTTLGEEPMPFVFFPHRQQYTATMTLLVRTGGAPRALLGAVRENVKALDPLLPLFGVTTLKEYVGTSLVPVRMAATLLGVMGALAVILAGVGIYGVVSYTVSTRTQEIGLRMALGAQKADILRMVLGQGMAMTLTGVTLGLAAAAGLTRFMTFLLYGISPLDPLTFLGIPLLLFLMALAASLVPALRSTRVAPADALRY